MLTLFIEHYIETKYNSYGHYTQECIKYFRGFVLILKIKPIRKCIFNKLNKR